MKVESGKRGEVPRESAGERGARIRVVSALPSALDVKPTLWRAFLTVLLCTVSICSLVSCQAQSTVTLVDDNPASPSQDGSSKVAMAEGVFDWPRLLGAGFDGKGQCDGLEFDWNQGPEIAWKLPVGDGYGLGSVAKGRYYHFDAATIDGQSFERLRCLKLEDASEVWSVQSPLVYRDLYGYEAGPRGTPAIHGDRIVSFGVGGKACCRDIKDGSLIWSVDTNQKYGVVQNFFGVGSSPLIWNDMVILAVGGSPAADQQIAPGQLNRVSPNGSALVALDLSTGKERWRTGDDLASYSSPRTMKMGDQTFVLYLARDNFLVVDPIKGTVLFSKRHRADLVESVNGMIPVVQGEHVFISECYKIGSVLFQAKPDQWEILWQDPPRNQRVQAMRSHWSTPVLIDGFLYGCSGRNAPDSDFRCVEFETGNVAWVGERGVRSSVSQAGGNLIVWGERGQMQVIRATPKQQEVVFKYDFSDELRYPCWAAPIVVGNRVLVRGGDNVMCLAVPLKTGDSLDDARASKR